MCRRDVDGAFFLAFFCAALRAFSFLFFVAAAVGGSMIGAANENQYAWTEGRIRASPFDIPGAVAVSWVQRHFFARQSSQAVRRDC